MLKLIGRVVFAPAKGLNVLAKKIASSEIVELCLTTALSFLVIVIVAANFWPIGNGWELLLITIISLIGIGVAIGIASAILAIVTETIIYITDAMARVYDKCAVCEEQNMTSHIWGLDRTSSAEVSLQYFIAKEANLSTCHAKYLG